eukprot:4630098-Prymnesium_polylepis.2
MQTLPNQSSHSSPPSRRVSLTLTPLEAPRTGTSTDSAMTFGLIRLFSPPQAWRAYLGDLMNAMLTDPGLARFVIPLESSPEV